MPRPLKTLHFSSPPFTYRTVKILHLIYMRKCFGVVWNAWHIQLSAPNGLIMLMTCLRFIGPFGRGGRGRARPDLDGMKKTIVCVCVRMNGGKYIRKGIWNWNQMCAWVCPYASVCKTQCLFQEGRPCDCLGPWFFLRVCGFFFKRSMSATIKGTG